jgi:16S rRNA G966 N2-methylase RsmD
MRQRRELTFKHNQGIGRHGWLRLTPAYSVKLVDDVLAAEPPELAVLDPFSGSGTTPLAAVSRGQRALATDINPFLVWFGKAKTRRYRTAEIESARSVATEVARRAGSKRARRAAPPPLHQIERWWSPDALDLLRKLRAGVTDLAPARGAARDLLDVAFCRTLMALSNAAFNHQSMSFRAPRHGGANPARFLDDASTVLESAAEPPSARARISHDDARELASVARGSFDRVVTSPPYPNRMSYVRELRPYMYWLGYFTEAREAGELDWRAIGGTWGVATSRLGEWEADGEPWPALARVVGKIRRSGAANAELLSRYVAKYFLDARAHASAVSARIARGGRVDYVVGNSTFYGVLVPTERLYAELLADHGFDDVRVVRLRKRNSKKELFEFDVRGTRRG